jgi:hypothetical protein
MNNWFQENFARARVPITIVAVLNMLFMAALTLFYYTRVHKLHEKSFHLFITGLVSFSLLV